MKLNQWLYGGNQINTFTNLNEKIIEIIKPIVENWADTKLSSDITVYGIRRYLRGAWLRLHVDKLPTRILSAILQVH